MNVPLLLRSAVVFVGTGFIPVRLLWSLLCEYGQQPEQQRQRREQQQPDRVEPCPYMAATARTGINPVPTSSKQPLPHQPQNFGSRLPPVRLQLHLQRRPDALERVQRPPSAGGAQIAYDRACQSHAVPGHRRHYDPDSTAGWAQAHPVCSIIASLGPFVQ